MAYWLFQGNPKYYRVVDAIRELDQMPWLMTRYVKEITSGDQVLIWLAGKEAGIYATATVVEAPKLLEKALDLEYWLDKSRVGTKPQAILKFSNRFIEEPLLRTEVMQDPVLKNLTVLRQLNQTNYKVTDQEWKKVQKLRG